jgi:hypothetical protein
MVLLNIDQNKKEYRTAFYTINALHLVTDRTPTVRNVLKHTLEIKHQKTLKAPTLKCVVVSK